MNSPTAKQWCTCLLASCLKPMSAIGGLKRDYAKPLCDKASDTWMTFILV